MRPARRRTWFHCGPEKCRGQSTVEFSAVTVLTLVLMLMVLEFGRMVLVYNTIANAARSGARYACVHGATRTGNGVTGPSGPAGNPSQVVAVIKDFAASGLLSTGNLIISVTYPGGSNAPGQTVSVSVIYPYDAFVTWFPVRPRLGSATQGVISF